MGMLETKESGAATAREETPALTLLVDPRGLIAEKDAAEFSVQNTYLAKNASELPAEERPINSLVFVLPARLSPEDRALVERCTGFVEQYAQCQVCAVVPFGAHFEEEDARETERFVTQLFQPFEDRRLTILRTGHVLSAGPTRLASWHPLAASRFQSCFVTVDELKAGIHQLLQDHQGPRIRTLTLLGKNRPLREVLKEKSGTGVFSAIQTGIATVLSCLLIGWLIGFVWSLIARYRKSWQAWQCHTLEPKSVGELLSLYNPLNYQHVALAGYNTGVVHFGWKFPGKTVVKTVGTGRRLRIDDDTLQVDAGKTLKEVIAALRDADRELFVVPNYSYISMGTIFFVPVHGSGSEVSVLGDTVESALLYDPLGDQLLRVKRDDSLFGKFMYNTQSQALVLRLKLRVRPKSRYFVRKEIRQSPSATEVWQVFHDREASNIELRKSKAADEAVEISKYYTSSDEQEEVLEVPKDSIGKLWDRLEENPITSYLFHEMVKRLGFHVELFLNEEEFPVFWDAHRDLPLSKIQLRYVRSDGLPHSPVGERDCISADIFMKRSESAKFLAFMKERLPDAKYNPGKHSM